MLNVVRNSNFRELWRFAMDLFYYSAFLNDYLTQCIYRVVEIPALEIKMQIHGSDSEVLIENLNARL